MVLPTLSAPAPDELEVTIFGPGFGESIVIHPGDDQWMVVDCCIHSESGRPAALWYLNEIGVWPTKVQLILASHWHDDHIRGMADLVASCPNAGFFCSAALTRSEFQKVAIQFNRGPSAVGSGLHEIQKTFSILQSRGELPQYAMHDMILWRSTSSGAEPQELASLSPSNAEYHRFLKSMAGMWVATSSKTKFRFPSPSPNELSVAAWLKMASAQVLLGADLEEHGPADRGWSAVLASPTRPPGCASLFKIAHHGSITGHHDGVWAEMLDPDPIAVLTPWNRGGKLPTDDDVERIVSLTPHAYSTSTFSPKKIKTGVSAVDRTLREMTAELRMTEPRTGFVRLRRSATTEHTGWTVLCSTEAGLLH